MHQHGALGAYFDAQLTDCLEERLRLNVTHSAANLNHRYVGIAGGQPTGAQMAAELAVYKKVVAVQRLTLE